MLNLGWGASLFEILASGQLRAVFYKNHQGHGDQGWTNFTKLGPYTSIDEPLFMAMKIPASVAPVFLDEICLISLI